ncbi:UDP-N-acetyl-D-mannosamine dehydrogenase [Emcibacter sp. SYSU 3D8]|uniref:UDP-N-acetyl-D-mannosamine dehydrogenase n=1 Tax=Emcibacter sp. SYSU 3D8 TaxID=3133969 RepID=UPI0031FE5520
MARFDKSICVLGLGYIGLPTASLLATRGYTVLGVDVDSRVVGAVQAGNLHFHEPDLDILVASAVGSGQLTADHVPAPADIYIIAVPTPFADDHAPDMSHVEAATRALAAHLRPGNLVILESTSPVGTTERIAGWIGEERPDLGPDVTRSDARIFLAHSPERVLPGRVLQELVVNDRIVGGIDTASAEAGAAFYRTFTTGTVFTTRARTAELSKLAENAFRDVNIAYANELSLICDRLGVNVWELIQLANRHPRVNILQPGPGVGGHCIAVDPWFIVHSAPEQSRLIQTAREVNDAKPRWVIDQVRSAADRFKDPVIACLGLAFKANIDDLRESPALAITAALAEECSAKILAVEPFVDECPASLSALLNVEFVGVDEALDRADILLLLVDHDRFKLIEREQLARKVLIDTRGVFR